MDGLGVDLELRPNPTLRMLDRLRLALERRNLDEARECGELIRMTLTNMPDTPERRLTIRELYRSIAHVRPERRTLIAELAGLDVAAMARAEERALWNGDGDGREDGPDAERPCLPGRQAGPANQAGPQRWSLDELLTYEFPPMEWVVADILPRGALAFLGGKKKVGKSWMALQLAQAVAASWGAIAPQGVCSI